MQKEGVLRPQSIDEIPSDKLSAFTTIMEIEEKEKARTERLNKMLGKMKNARR